MQQTRLRLLSKDYRNLGSVNHLGSQSPLSVLQELHRLLEDYAPVWYTEEQHLRVLAALQEPNS